METLWEMWPQMPTYGRKSAQFVDLLGYLSISTPQVLEKVCGGCSHYMWCGVCGCSHYMWCGVWGVHTVWDTCLFLYHKCWWGYGLYTLYVATCKGLEYAYYVYLHIIIMTVGRSNKTDWYRAVLITWHYIPLQESLCQGYVERAIDLLKGLNSQVSTHANFHIYSQLQNLVDFDGFYLENEPCLVCNDPEIPYSVSESQ